MTKVNTPLAPNIINDQCSRNSFRMISKGIANGVVSVHISIQKMSGKYFESKNNWPFTLLKIHYTMRNKASMPGTSSGTNPSGSKIRLVDVGSINGPVIATGRFLQDIISNQNLKYYISLTSLFSKD